MLFYPMLLSMHMKDGVEKKGKISKKVTRKGGILGGFKEQKLARVDKAEKDRN